MATKILSLKTHRAGKTVNINGVSVTFGDDLIATIDTQEDLDKVMESNSVQLVSSIGPDLELEETKKKLEAMNMEALTAMAIEAGLDSVVVVQKKKKADLIGYILENYNDKK